MSNSRITTAYKTIKSRRHNDKLTSGTLASAEPENYIYSSANKHSVLKVLEW